MTTEPEPGDRVVEQRVRNRIIDWLELASSFADQRRYDKARVVNVSHEVLNQWDDCVSEGIVREAASDVHTADEVAALRAVERAVNTANGALPPGYPKLRAVHRLAEWRALADASAEALTVFGRRGRMSEDVEE